MKKHKVVYNWKDTLISKDRFKKLIFDNQLTYQYINGNRQIRIYKNGVRLIDLYPKGSKVCIIRPQIWLSLNPDKDVWQSNIEEIINDEYYHITNDVDNDSYYNDYRHQS